MSEIEISEALHDMPTMSSAEQGVIRASERRVRLESLSIRVVQLLIAIALFSLWEWGARTGFVSTFMFGSPSEVWDIALRRIENGSLIYSAYVTGLETILGFVMGSVLGTALGLGLWYSRYLARVMQVFILALGSVPVLALGPLIIIWFGVGIPSKVILATISCVIIALLQAYEGAQQVDKDLVRLLMSFGATKRQIFLKVVVPSSVQLGGGCRKIECWVRAYRCRDRRIYFLAGWVG